jgi:arylsulfatase A
MEYGMKRIAWVRVFVTVLLGVLAASLGAAERPNVIIILADDLGWADLPSYGNRFHETPALDRLAAEGMRFTQFYSGAVCSPTRSNLQSGRHEARYGITQHIPGHRRPFAKLIDPAVPLQLPLEVETLAERLGASGYETGYFGKWHLGGEGFGPADQGWKTALEVQKHVVPPEVSGSAGPRRTAAFLTEKAVAFIEEHRDEPFLLQVSHYAVHIPISTTPELLEKYRNKEKVPGFPCLPEYAGLLEELDASVGGIVAAVDRLGLAEKTMIVFVSDNGGLVHDQGGKVYTSNAPLRSEKGTLYEGGIRVPAIRTDAGVRAAGHGVRNASGDDGLARDHPRSRGSSPSGTRAARRGQSTALAARSEGGFRARDAFLAPAALPSQLAGFGDPEGRLEADRIFRGRSGRAL